MRRLCHLQHLCPTWFIWRWVSNSVFADLLLHSAESGLHTPPSWLRASPLPLTLILYHKIREKSIGNVAQSFNQIIVQNDEAPIKRRALAVGATANPKRRPSLSAHWEKVYEDQLQAAGGRLGISQLRGGYTLRTKRSRLCPLWLGLLVRVLQGLPSSPQSSVIRMPTATPHLLSLSAVARLCTTPLGQPLHSLF